MERYGSFFVVINLQNSQWNTNEELSFCLNIGIALTAELADKEKKKATYHDSAIILREEKFLTEEQNRNENIRGGLGYKITDKTNVIVFIADLKIDLEENILKRLGEFKTLQDWLLFCKRFDFWHEQLMRKIDKCGIKLDDEIA